MAALLGSEAKATTASRRDTSTGATASNDGGGGGGGGGDSGKTTPAAAPAGSHGSDAVQLTTTTSSAGIPDDDELFELDIALLDGRGDAHRHGRPATAAEDDHDGADDHDGHALLANCLLPLRSVSKAVPVDACSSGGAPWSSALSSSSYPYSGYYSARRLAVCAGGASSRRFLSFLGGGRPGTTTGSSARFCFSRRGFETVGNYYFQRY